MKDFKVAQIVPRSCLDLIKDNHYHMCLAHLVYEERFDWSGSGDRRYINFYRSMSDKGKYVLMDNGAAEDAQLQVDDLLAMYELVRPSEIVVPDTLLDSSSTLRKMDKFVSEYDSLPYKFMGVPQGNNLEEWSECAKLMVKCGRINTIGISKFINIVTGDPMARYSAACQVQSLASLYGRDDIEVHLLGCDEGPAIVRYIRDQVPIVRGCDSAFAYIAAKAGVVIDRRTKRPNGEIDFLDGTEPDGLRNRLFEMEAECGAIYNTSGERWRDE